MAEKTDVHAALRDNKRNHCNRKWMNWFHLDFCLQAASVMQNQQVQQLWVPELTDCIKGGFKVQFCNMIWVNVTVSLFWVSMSGMMSNAVGGPAAGVGGLSDISSLIEA